MSETKTILKVFRADDCVKQTNGHLVVYKNGVPVFTCLTLELPWKDNERNISCIPPMTYTGVKHTSPKFGASVHIKGVPERSEILIHPANYVRQLRGCIAVGYERLDIDSDGEQDVTLSRKSMKKLLSHLPDSFKIQVIDQSQS